MFTKSARIYDALYHFKDYKAAAQQLHELIQTVCPGARSLLDVGCGTGKHIEELRKHYAVEGADIDPGMLDVARTRCPDVPFHLADMTDFSLGRSFDVVTCLFSSIGYVKTPERMALAVACMARHVTPKGAVFLEPWLSPEQYWVGRITGNYVDEPELKIAWMYTSERIENVSRFFIHYLVGKPDGVEHFTETHDMGLFTDAQYAEAFRNAGLNEVRHDARGLFGRGMYTGTRT